MNQLKTLAEKCGTMSVATALMSWAKSQRLKANKRQAKDHKMRSMCTLAVDCRMAWRAVENISAPGLDENCDDDGSSEDEEAEDDEDGQDVSFVVHARASEESRFSGMRLWTASSCPRKH